MNKNVSRRQLLKYGAIAAAALPVAAVAGPAFAKGKEDREVRFDKEYDVIVVGTGVAGTTAGIRAAELGNKVLMVEKMSMFGGTSLVSGLNFACVNSPFQEKLGIKDDPEFYAKDMAKVAGNYGSYEHAITIAKTTRRVYDFWTSKGVVFKDIKGLGGHSVKRALWADGGGRGIILPLHKYIADKLPNCTMQKETKVDDIVFDKNGKVIGVRVREGYRFDYDAKNDDKENTTGVTKYYKAKKGVIFASGGFCRDTEMMSAESSMFGAAQTIANPGALSGTMKMLIRNGAHPVNMALVRFAYPIPTEDLSWGMMIDAKSGKRFINELNVRNVIGPRILRLKAENGGTAPIIIWDSVGIENFHDKQRLKLSLEAKNGLNGTIYKFETLEELAKYFKLDTKTVKTAAENYNKMITAGKDTEFDKNIAEMKGAAVAKAPFYGMVVNPRITYTPGGVRISVKGEVLSIAEGAPVKGLFACGEVTGGIHGESRLTAGSSPDCGTFGLISAENLHKIQA